MVRADCVSGRKGLVRHAPKKYDARHPASLSERLSDTERLLRMMANREVFPSRAALAEAADLLKRNAGDARRLEARLLYRGVAA